MINLFNCEIVNLSLHRAGNKSRNEPMILSEKPYELTEVITPLLKEYFLKPFREKEEVYFQFSHEVSLEYNDMYTYCKKIFENPEQCHKISKHITQHLFDQSNHPHIKSGEVYIAHFKNVWIDGNTVDAIGVFKSELMNDFLQFEQKETSLEMILQSGINLNKLDKGVIIFNYKPEEGYKILCVDSNRYDARYWLENFLCVDAFEDEHFLTKKYMKFCQGFARDIVFPAEDKKEEVMFLNRTVNFFNKNDQFAQQQFIDEVIGDKTELIQEFQVYKANNSEKYSIEEINDFPISGSAVKEVSKKFKGEIHLDTNMTIKMDFMNPESAERYIEKGWDEERQMYYYLVYFNKEQK